MVHVPYKGAGPAINDLLAGQVLLMFSNPTSTVPHVKSGKLRALGVMDNKRNPALPDVPTALEAGLPELANVIEWYGVVVPAATPRETVQRLDAAVLRRCGSPDVRRAHPAARPDAVSRGRRRSSRGTSAATTSAGGA